MAGIIGKVNSNDIENAKIERKARQNPADSDFGMGAGDDDLFSNFDDTAFQSGGTTPDATGGLGGGLTDFSNFGNTGMGMGFNSNFSGLGMQQPQQPPKKSTEDEIFGVILKFLKGAVGFFGELSKSFKTFNVRKRAKMGKNTVTTGVIASVVGLLLLLFGKRQFGLDLLVSGLVTSGISVVIYMWAVQDIVDGNVPEEPAYTQDEQPMLNDSDAMESLPPDFEDDDFYTGDEDDEFGSFEDDEEPLGYNSQENFEAFTSDVTPQDVIEKNMETTLETIEYNNGMLTRQYLYERMTAVLASTNSNFDSVRVIDENTQEFAAWDALVAQCAELFRSNSNTDMPYLIEAKEKLFYYVLKIRRVKWLKDVDKFKDEIVRVYQHDEVRDQLDEEIYGVVYTVGDIINVKIMKGEAAVVSVLDAYNRVKEDVLNTKNYMPVVLGIDPEGYIIWRDFKSMDSLIVAGMPRSGKSWTVLSILAQMMFFLSPAELNVYILDKKGMTSDFRHVRTPHVKKFAGDVDDIVSTLRYVVKVLAEERKRIIGSDDCVNIWDYKEKNPDVDMPLLYVVIDEVVSLADELPKEMKDEFQGLLRVLISQLPNLGIRAFLIPHVVKDQIISKTATDIMPCRISVKGDAGHIEKTTGAKEKDFKHRLTHMGDMAVRFGNDKTAFVHSVVLSDHNDKNKMLFEFLRKFWSKLYPDSVKDSVYTKLIAEKGASNAQKVEQKQREVNVSMAPRGLSKAEQDALLRDLDNFEF